MSIAKVLLLEIVVGVKQRFRSVWVDLDCEKLVDPLLRHFWEAVMQLGSLTTSDEYRSEHFFQQLIKRISGYSWKGICTRTITRIIACP